MDIGKKGTTVQCGATDAASADSNAGQIRTKIEEQVQWLRSTPLFLAAAQDELDLNTVKGILPHLYTFSLLFERILMRRMSLFKGNQFDLHLMEEAHRHLLEEIGHFKLFQSILIELGYSSQEIQNIRPLPATETVYGYFLLLMEEYDAMVVNIGIMQCLETIGQEFFGTLLPYLQKFNLPTAAFQEHTHLDEDHANIGYDLYHLMSSDTLARTLAVIEQIFTLMSEMLNKWLEHATGRARQVEQEG